METKEILIGKFFNSDNTISTIESGKQYSFSVDEDGFIDSILTQYYMSNTYNGVYSISYYSHGKLHRDKNDEPSIISYYRNGVVSQLEFYRNNIRHRFNEPANIYFNKEGNIESKEYFICGSKRIKTGTEFKSNTENCMLDLPKILESDKFSLYGELEEVVKYKIKTSIVYCLIGKTKLMICRNMSNLPFKIYDEFLNEVDYENYHFCEKIDSNWISGFNLNYTITFKYIHKIFESEEEIDLYLKKKAPNCY